MKYLIIIYYIWVHCPISILYEEFHSCDFTKNIWMKFFIQTSINVWKRNCFLKKHYHLRYNKNCEGRFVSKSIFSVFQNAKRNEKKTLKIIQNTKCTKKQIHFLARNIPPWCVFTLLITIGNGKQKSFNSIVANLGCVKVQNLENFINH